MRVPGFGPRDFPTTVPGSLHVFVVRLGGISFRFLDVLAHLQGPCCTAAAAASPTASSSSSADTACGGGGATTRAGGGRAAAGGGGSGSGGGWFTRAGRRSTTAYRRFRDATRQQACGIQAVNKKLDGCNAPVLLLVGVRRCADTRQTKQCRSSTPGNLSGRCGHRKKQMSAA